MASAGGTTPGSNYAIASSTAEDVVISKNANLTIGKIDNKSTSAVGGTNPYVITVSNSGPNNANGVVLSDTLGANVTCPGANTVTCTVSAGAALCPAAPLTVNNLLTGLTLNTLPASSGLSFAYSCNVP